MNQRIVRGLVVPASLAVAIGAARAQEGGGLPDRAVERPGDRVRTNPDPALPPQDEGRPARPDRAAPPVLACIFPEVPSVAALARTGAGRGVRSDPGEPARRARLARPDALANVRDSVPPSGFDEVPGLGGRAFRMRHLVVPLRFSNHDARGQDRRLPTRAELETILDSEGGDVVLAPSGSLRDYFLEVSYGRARLRSTVTDWHTLERGESYYAARAAGLTPRVRELVLEGLAAIDADVDFRDFDVDGDGRVDAITFLHSGYGAEYLGSDQYGTGFENRVWTQMGTLPTWTSAEGVTVSEYALAPALFGAGGSVPVRIGVLAHELGHFLGLPDLHDRQGGTAGAGNWSLMAGGAWGFDGTQLWPAHPSAWSKVMLGWVVPRRIDPGTYSARRVETDPSVFLIDSGYPPGEYLLVENRQPWGFDALVPQGGIAVWHVDEAQGSLSFGEPNGSAGHPAQDDWPENGRHYRNALLQADGLYELERDRDRGDGADLYRGGGGVNALSEATSPSTDAYRDGAVIVNQNRLLVLSASGARMSFVYANPSKPFIAFTGLPPAPVGAGYRATLTANGGTGELRWTEHREDAAYRASLARATAFEPVGVPRGWRADEGVWAYDLPFAFPFWADDHRRVWVSSNGFLDLLPLSRAEPTNARSRLALAARIAPLWDDLDTSVGDDDVFVDESVDGEVTIRWQAHARVGESPCNASVTLRRDGGIVFRYGAGNARLTPTVGISRGRGAESILPPGHDGARELADAPSVVLHLEGSRMPPGLRFEGAELVGVVTQPGVYTPTLRVTDDRHVYDERTITLRAFLDCNGNGIDDALEADCNGNGLPDDCDIASGASLDADGDGVPDDCQARERPARLR